MSLYGSQDRLGDAKNRPINPPHLVHLNLVVRVVSPSFRTLKFSGIRSAWRVRATCIEAGGHDGFACRAVSRTPSGQRPNCHAPPWHSAYWIHMEIWLD